MLQIEGLPDDQQADARREVAAASEDEARLEDTILRLSEELKAARAAREAQEQIRIAQGTPMREDFFPREVIEELPSVRTKQLTPDEYVEYQKQVRTLNPNASSVQELDAMQAVRSLIQPGTLIASQDFKKIWRVNIDESNTLDDLSEVLPTIKSYKQEYAPKDTIVFGWTVPVEGQDEPLFVTTTQRVGKEAILKALGGPVRDRKHRIYRSTEDLDLLYLQAQAFAQIGDEESTQAATNQLLYLAETVLNQENFTASSGADMRLALRYLYEFDRARYDEVIARVQTYARQRIHDETVRNQFIRAYLEHQDSLSENKEAEDTEDDETPKKPYSVRSAEVYADFARKGWEAQREKDLAAAHELALESAKHPIFKK